VVSNGAKGEEFDGGTKVKSKVMVDGKTLNTKLRIVKE
jgi:hypothetical protein